MAEDGGLPAVLHLGFEAEDGIALLARLEALLGITITGDEAEAVSSVGDLHKLLMVKALDGGETCATAMMFYRLRRALRGMGAGGAIVPATPLTQLQVASPRQALKELAARTGLACPLPAATLLDIGLLLLAALGVVACLVFALLGSAYAAWMWLSAGAVVLLVIQQWRAPGLYPVGLETVGALARRVAALNQTRFASGRARSDASTLWSILVETILEVGHSTHDEIGRDDIGPDAVFSKPR